MAVALGIFLAPSYILFAFMPCQVQSERLEPDFAPVASFSVGSAEIHLLTDGEASVEAEWVFNSKGPQVAEQEVPHYFEDKRVKLAFGCALVQVEGKNILLDTSLGEIEPPLAAFRKERPVLDLRDLLQRAAGLAPEDIHFVVHSHLHRDHVSWNVVPSKDGPRPLFRNAKHVIQQAELSYWASTEALRSHAHFATYVQPIVDAGMVLAVDGDHELLPGITLKTWPGHTPGHQIVQIRSGGQVAYYVGDSIHSAAQLLRPEWCPWFDWVPEAAKRMRRGLLAQISDENAVMLSPHLAFPGAGRLTARSDSGYHYEQLEGLSMK